MSYYQKHIFLCTNVKSDNRKCCGQGCANAAREFIKEKLSQSKLQGAGKIRLSTTGCLGRCQEGPSLVIYPEGTWYTYHSLDDVNEIIEKHIINGELVEKLLMR